jgi:hypothetical protein
MQCLLLFHGSNGYANAPQCHVIRTLPLLLTFYSRLRLGQVVPFSYVQSSPNNILKDHPLSLLRASFFAATVHTRKLSPPLGTNTIFTLYSVLNETSRFIVRRERKIKTDEWKNLRTYSLVFCTSRCFHFSTYVR